MNMHCGQYPEKTFGHFTSHSSGSHSYLSRGGMIMKLVNNVRGYYYLSGVLMNQMRDPFCHICKAFVNTSTAAQQSLTDFERSEGAEIQGLPAELQRIFAEAKTALAGVVLPDNAVGQKKAGNCKLPEGVCFVKSARALLQNLSGTI
jgi:hypothetical protein